MDSQNRWRTLLMIVRQRESLTVEAHITARSSAYAMIQTVDICMTMGTWEGKAGGGKYVQMMEKTRLKRNGDSTEPTTERRTRFFKVRK
jgi:hypothetical protein